MPGHELATSEALPRSHYFLTVSRGSRMRTVALRAALVHIAAIVAPLLLVAGLGSGLYLALHDDIVAELMRRQSDMQYAYEDRIEGLRHDIERQTERGRVDQTKVDSRVHDLLSREAKLESRAAVMADLGGGASASGHRTELPTAITGRVPALPETALGFAGADKPHPVFEPAAAGPAAAPSPARPEDHAWLLDDPHVPLADRLRAADLSLDRVERAQVDALSRIGSAAHQRIARIRSVIEETGLSPERYLAKAPAAGLGGPFVPLPEGLDSAFSRAVADLRGTVSAAAQLDGALGRLPIAAPLLGRMEVTSPFGARTDPFLGRPALHTGVDLREGFGTDIRATAAGRVIFAGTAGGYGNMVEVDHGNGVTTRYAHMGGFAVSEGQAVARGSVLGAVGATGRATGPHLHYEVRIDGDPVDPMRFLAGADRVASIAAP